MRLELYTKRDCPLCDEAREVLEELALRVPFTWRTRWLDDEPALRPLYRYLIPALCVDGEVRFVHRIDPAKLEALVRAGGTGVADPGPEDG